MLVMDNYWDMLPPELHELIIAYKIGQEYIDEKRERMMRDLCHEIMKYGELKRKWEIGHVKCIVKKDSFFKPYIVIKGCYVDEEDDVNRERFLGFDFKTALQRVNHVKSFI